MNDDYMSEADNEVDGGYFADLEYEYQQKEIRRQEDKENKAKKEENRKQQLLRQNKCIENLKAKLERKNQQIDQLKQQLEESFTEEDVEGLIEDRDKTIKFLQKELAEKDKEINSLIVDYEKRISQEQKLMSNMEHLLTEKQNAIDEINKEFAQAVHDWKVLCAEKDKKIELLNTMISTLPAHDKEIKEHELEKVKDFILENTMLETETAAVLTYIYQQIKELKGEKDVKD